MHWDKHEFSLPTIKRSSDWHVLINTDDINAPFKKTETKKTQDQRSIVVEGRSCVVLVSKESAKKVDKKAR